MSAGFCSRALSKRVCICLALDDRACRDKVAHAIRDATTTTETRRQKKMKQQSVPNNFASREHAFSRYGEMKSDMPEPVNFHDAYSYQASFAGQANAFPTMQSSGNPYSGCHSTIPVVTDASGRFLLQASLEPHQTQQQQQQQQQQQRQRPSGCRSLDISPHDEANFMRLIDEVLGPMPPNHYVDPLADILNLTSPDR